MDKNMPTHLYGFSNKYFYVTIKARSLVGAIEKYKMLFGEKNLNLVREISSSERDE